MASMIYMHKLHFSNTSATAGRVKTPQTSIDNLIYDLLRWGKLQIIDLPYINYIMFLEKHDIIVHVRFLLWQKYRTHLYSAGGI
jgi:Na+-transporting NADH:ubiquinone oxidoreductase subunit NqrE